MKTVIQILTEARELIAKPEGWTKGIYSSAIGGGGWCYCAMGALIAASPDNTALDTVEGVMHSVIAPFTLITWNDMPERKHADVVTAFDDAIALATSLDDAAEIVGEP